MADQNCALFGCMVAFGFFLWIFLWFYRTNSYLNIVFRSSVIFVRAPTQKRFGFSHLREHKFRHNFADTVDPFCNCRNNSLETTQHFLMHCSVYSNDRHMMFNSLQQLDLNLLPLNPETLCKLLLYGDPNLSFDQNHAILYITIKFICDSGRFDGPLF